MLNLDVQQLASRAMVIYKETLKSYPVFKDFFDSPERFFIINKHSTSFYGINSETINFITNNSIGPYETEDVTISVTIMLDDIKTKEGYLNTILKSFGPTLVETFINRYAESLSVSLALTIHKSFIQDEDEFNNVIQQVEDFKNSVIDYKF